MRPSNNLENKILSDTMKSSASIWRSPDSQFFRTTTGIQWRPDAFDESRLVMTFWTNLGVTGILCTFRLVLEGKKHFLFGSKRSNALFLKGWWSTINKQKWWYWFLGNTWTQNGLFYLKLDIKSSHASSLESAVRIFLNFCKMTGYCK